MAKNPFSPNKSFVNKPNRNAFDLSFSNHLSFSFGQLVPVMCKEVLPGDSFKIDSALGLRFMPLAFPIQTKCRAHVHFFYQRLKNIWSESEDFLYGNDKLQGRSIVPPYLAFDRGQFQGIDNLRTCSLGDYLGLPTVSYNIASLGDHVQPPVVKTVESSPNDFLHNIITTDDDEFSYPTNSNFEGPGNNPIPLTNINFDKFYCIPFSFVVTTPDAGTHAKFLRGKTIRFVIDLPQSIGIDVSLVQGYVVFSCGTTKETSLVSCSVDTIEKVGSHGSEKFSRCSFEATVPRGFMPSQFESSFGLVSKFLGVSSHFPTASLSFVNALSIDAVQSTKGSMLTKADFRISALPFRCYESIYNAFYRDNRNNPLIVDGKPVYNTYCSNMGSGADLHHYFLFNRNWEYDQFTSAVPSPQQGVAPLVGISSTGDVTFSYEGQDYTFSTETADDADTIVKVNVSENIPNEVARSVVNTVTSGISINDFRNVNAYQRWLETNIRRGLKYKDQTLARWGVEPKTSLLDMPEFIGGYSVDIDINTVTNTNGDGSSPLGDYAAQASCFGGSSHKIQQYCDQHGFIMAIISVVPTPVYSQLLSKMFTRGTALDYYSPEFGQIGLQSVKYGELCPLETTTDGEITPNTVFGYQRPWYEYMYSNDEAHGLFRTDYNQFLMSRVFSEPPVLGPDFLTIKESSLNDVFSVKNRNNILGMVRFNIEAHRPIPSVSIPSL